MRRRRFLRLASTAAAAIAAGRPGGAQVPLPSPVPSSTPPPLPPLPRVNGGLNVQPLRRYDSDPGPEPPLLVPELVDAQMRLVYDLGFESIRVTLSFNRFGADFLGAIPYVRAARALGVDVLGVLSDFAGLDLPQALVRQRTRAEVLETYLGIFHRPVAPASAAVPRPGEFALQVLNEPTHFLGITPESYVADFLAPAYADLKRRAPDLTVVSAAPVGNVDGYLRVRAMLRAGLEGVCDRVAYHVYSRRLLERLPGLTAKTVWITESGALGSENHLPWFRDTLAEIRRAVAGVERIFYFLLFDFAPRGYRIVDIVPRAGGFAAVAESAALVDHLQAGVLRATGGLPHASYEQLVPDIRAYFPTDEDRALIASTSFGRP